MQGAVDAALGLSVDAEAPAASARACRRAGACRLALARLPHASRAWSKKRKRRPAEGHRQPRRRTGCTPETHSSRALQNDTLRPEPAPAGMLQGLPIAAERRAVGWGEMGRGAGEGVATSTTGFLRRRARASGEERLVPTSSRILFHLSRLMVAVSAANLVGWRARLAVGRVGRWRGRRCRAGQRLAVGRVWGAGSAPRRRPLVFCCADARERRGAACADLLPADSSPFPVKDCSSGREPGSLRLPGGWLLGSGWAVGAGARCDVDRRLPAARARRARRGAARVDLLPDTSSPFPVNGCRSGRESGPLRLPGWAAASGG